MKDKQAKGKATAPGCASEKLAAATAKALASPGNGNGAAGQLSKNTRRHIRELDRDIERAEEALAALEVELALPDTWATPESSKASAARHGAATREVEEAFALGGGRTVADRTAGIGDRMLTRRGLST